MAQDKSAENATDPPNEMAEATLGVGRRGSEAETPQVVHEMGESQGGGSPVAADNRAGIAQDSLGNGPADASISEAGGHGGGEDMAESEATTGDKRRRASKNEGQQGAGLKSKRAKTEPLEPIMFVGHSPSVRKFDPGS